MTYNQATIIIVELAIIIILLFANNPIISL
jgi:hypothetical protein